MKSAILGNSRVRKGGILVQNVKNQFLHQLPRTRIWVVQTFTFGIYFTYLGNYLHHFHSRVISHTRHIVLRSPW